MTRRVIRAIENPQSTSSFTPTRVSSAGAAARTATVLEINAQPERLGITDVQVRRACEAGVKMAIDSDAHNAGDLRFPRLYGIYVARRGWAARRDIVNTRSLDEMLAALKPRVSTAA